ncbi:MAG: YihY/virulence factor BrkB family protein, partial [Allosphingosinicella sp.]
MAIEKVKWPAASDWRQILGRTWKESGDDNVSLLAAGVAFYAFLAFVPLLASAVLTYGLVADPETVAAHIRSLAQTLPEQAATIIGDQLQGMTGGDDGAKGLGLLIAILFALYGASKGAGAVITALNVAYDIEEQRGFVSRTLVALGMTLGAVVVLLVAAGAISALGFIEALLPFSSPFLHQLLKFAFFAVAAVAASLVLAFVYRHGPNRPDAPWMWITPGSAAATLLWLIATLGFGLYVSNFGNYNATYGSLGGVVVFLTWLYLSAYILLMGAELNAELERQQAGTARESAADQAAAKDAPEAAA